MMASRAFSLIFVSCFVHICVGKFVVPSARIEAFYPKGFRVSIPDEDGISLFGIHVSSNPMYGPEVGLWARDVTRPQAGRWTYVNREAELKIGQTIYFWTYILYNGAGYRQEDGEWIVKAYVTESGESVEYEKIVAQASMKPPEPGFKILPGENCRTTASVVQGGGEICSGDLLFESDFNVLSTLDGKWTPEVVFPEAPDYPFVVYMNGDHISLQKGRLSIRPVFLEERFGEGFTRKELELAGCTGAVGTRQCKRSAFAAQILPPIVSGKLTTKKTFNFKYGRVEVGAKLPRGNWILPEIVLEPSEHKYGSSNYASGIIKIASARGNEDYSRELVGGVIMSDKAPFRTYGLRARTALKSWNNDLHNFTLVWTPDQISVYVDGDNYGNIKPAEGFSKIGMENNVGAASEWARGTKIAPFDEMFYISLGIRSGGVKDFMDEPKKPWKNTSPKAIVSFWKSRHMWYSTWANGASDLQVEYVRVYAL